MEMPKWATPDRRAFLVEIFTKSKGFCIYGHDPCPNPREHCYEVISEDMIGGWKEEDRILQSVLLEKEKRRRNALSTIWRRGPFDSITRDEYLAKRPTWRIKAIGVNAFTQQRVALVEIPGLLNFHIWINLCGLPGISKHKLRKLVRYGKGSLPKGLVIKAETRVDARVRDFLK